MLVHANAAMSLDGRLGLPGRRPLALSSKEDFARVHRLRHDLDAILVGSGTVLADDPGLLVKPEHLPAGTMPRNPTRVVLDGRLRSPPTARVFDGRAPTLVYAAGDTEGERANAEVIRLGPRPLDPRGIVADLERRGFASVLVEGGAHVLASFLEARVVDILTLYVAPVLVGEGGPSLVEGHSATSAGDVLGLSLRETTRLGEGVLLTLEPAR